MNACLMAAPGRAAAARTRQQAENATKSNYPKGLMKYMHRKRYAEKILQRQMQEIFNQLNRIKPDISINFDPDYLVMGGTPIKFLMRRKNYVERHFIQSYELPLLTTDISEDEYTEQLCEVVLNHYRTFDQQTKELQKEDEFTHPRESIKISY